MPHSSNQTSLFLDRVSDYMSPLPPMVTENTSCLAAVQCMREALAAQVLVQDACGHISGMLSSIDILQRGIFIVDAQAPVQRIMQKPVQTVVEDMPLFRALVSMRHQSLTNLLVVDACDRPKGMLHTETLFNRLWKSHLSLAESIVNDETTADLRQARHSQVELVEMLLRQRVLPAEILTVLSTLNDRLYHRVLEQSIQALVDRGWGKPPLPFAVVVTGSAGRRESLLRPDQDNGFILADYPNEDYPQVNAYFYELASAMTQRLNTAGMPLCSGHVMATNHAWRKRLSEWQTQLLGWLRRPSVAATTLMDIWIDFRGVFGDQRLVETLREQMSKELPRHHGFLRELEALQCDHDVAITPLRTLKREHLPGQYGHRKVDIKRKALRPLVEGVRILALREGISATATLTRLAGLKERRKVSVDLANALEEAFQFLIGLLLQAQLADHHQERPPGPYVAPEKLSRLERKCLKEALRVVTRLRSMVHTEFTAELF